MYSLNYFTKSTYVGQPQLAKRERERYKRIKNYKFQDSELM